MNEIILLSHHSSIVKLSLFWKAFRSMLFFFFLGGGHAYSLLHVVSKDELLKCIPESEP